MLASFIIRKMAVYLALRQLVPDPDRPADAAALRALVPALTPLASTPQDSIYHAEGDVWTHTLMVVEALTRLEVYHRADADTRFVLFAAALFHDIAKPVCTVREDDGRITSKGHSGMGAIDARILLWKGGVPFALRERICQIIAVHQVPFFALGHDRRGRRPELIAHILSWDTRLSDLCAVAEADMRGRVSVHQAQALDDIALFEVLAQEENCWDHPKAFPDAHTRLHYARSLGQVPLEAAFHQPAGSSVTVMAGLPASGKNTWVAKHRSHLPVISFDDAKAELGIKPGETAGAAVHLAHDRAKVLLREKAPFVWNATHLDPLLRAKTLDLLYRYGAQVEMVYLEAPAKTLFARNAARDTTLSNKKLEGMLRGWDMPSPCEVHHLVYPDH
jgi:predicted kinase